MSRFLNYTGLINAPVTIDTLSLESIGVQLVSTNSPFSTATALTANVAYFVPVELVSPMPPVVKMILSNGTHVAGNVDVGIYDAAGSRIVSFGSTLQTGVSVTQAFDIVDTNLSPGLYYMAVACSATGAVTGFGTVFIDMSLNGVFIMTGAFPLPASFAGAKQQYSGTFIPMIAMTMNTVI